MAQGRFQLGAFVTSGEAANPTFSKIEGILDLLKGRSFDDGKPVPKSYYVVKTTSSVQCQRSEDEDDTLISCPILLQCRTCV